MAGLVGRALEAARRALRDLDHDQVPAALRRVAAHSGDLTPPLADRLLRELDVLDWLRTKALEAWPEADPDAPGPDRASALFLARPDGWVGALVAEAGEAMRALAAADAARSDRDRESLERSLAASRDRERELRRQLAEALTEARELRRRASEPRRAERAGEARVRDELARERARWAATLADMEERVSALDEEVSVLREELHRTRVARAEMANQLESMRGGSRWSDRDPVDLAAFIDDVAAQARPSRSVPDSARAGPAAFELPPGVRPDEARAVDALLVHPGPLLVVVDGYNVALSMWTGPPADSRSRLETLLRRLLLIAPPTMRVSVVWDSSIDGAAATRSGRLEVRFADGNATADDVVVGLAGDSAVPAVVVSNDREVRERAARAGADALWADALVAWAAMRR
jgi:hypothetical protein